MTEQGTEPEKIVYFEVPKGTRWRRGMNAAPAVIEVRIDINRNDAEPEEVAKVAPLAAPLRQAIETAVEAEPDPGEPGLPGLLGRLGQGVRDRFDEIIDTAGGIIGQRIDDTIDRANAQIDELVNEKVNAAMDAVVHNLIEQRIGDMLGVEIDLTDDSPLVATGQPTPSDEEVAPAGTQPTDDATG